MKTKISSREPRQLEGKMSFRRRYDALEQMRLDLLTRLSRAGADEKSETPRKRAQFLLTRTFRKATLAQRAAVLQSAEFMIGIVENMSGMV